MEENKNNDKYLSFFLLTVMYDINIWLGVNVFTAYFQDMPSFTTLPISNCLLIYLNNEYMILYDFDTTSCEIFIFLF